MKITGGCPTARRKSAPTCSLSAVTTGQRTHRIYFSTTLVRYPCYAKAIRYLLIIGLVSLQYESRATKGKPPSSRGYHAAIVTDCRLFLFGGFNGHEVHEDVYILDLAGAAYLPQVMSFVIDV